MSNGEKDKTYFVETASDGSRREWTFEAGLRRLDLFLKLARAGMNPRRVQSELDSLEQQKRASKPRKPRPPKLWKRGLRCLPSDATASQLLDWLDAEPMTYDEHDIEMVREGDSIVVRDLATDETDRIPALPDKLRNYLSRARNN